MSTLPAVKQYEAQSIREVYYHTEYIPYIDIPDRPYHEDLYMTDNDKLSHEAFLSLTTERPRSIDSSFTRHQQMSLASIIQNIGTLLSRMYLPRHSCVIMKLTTRCYCDPCVMSQSPNTYTHY